MSGARVVVSGYTSVDTRLVTSALPRPGETALLEGQVLPPPRWGGCAPNIALWLERLGVHAALVAWLGDDDEGRLYRSLLEEAGVDLSALEVGAGPSARAWLVYDEAGEAICLFHPAGSGAQGAETAAPLAEQAEWLAVTVGPARLTSSLLEIFADTALAWNVKADRQAFPPELVARLAVASVVSFNRSETVFLGDALALGRPAEPDDLLERGAGLVALTRGREGALLAWSDERVELAQEAMPVSDATGAGDAFFAGLLAGLAEGAAPAEAGRLGMETASRHLQAGRAL
jgi:sugar/nucleoside kinase (ribokinase family)